MGINHKERQGARIDRQGSFAARVLRAGSEMP